MQKSVAPPSVVMPAARTRRLALEWLLVGGVVALGFALRVWAVRWGLPYVDHPDEPAIVNIALRMLKSGDLNPHWFLYPSFYLYLLLAVLSLHYRWGLANGVYPALNQMVITTDLYTTIPEFFVWGRLLTITIGSATIWSAYALGKRAWSRSAGLVAALFIATAPFHVLHSQMITTDVTSGWLVLLSFLGALAILRDGRWRSYLVAGVFAGLAGATKYNAAVIVLPIMVAHVLYWRRAALQQLPRLIAGGAASIGGFVLGTPYAVLAWSEWSSGVLYQLAHYNAGAHGDLIGRWPVLGYLDFFWGDGLRQSVSIAALAGLIVLWIKRRDLALVWLSFAVPYLLIHMAQETHFVRNLVPLVVLCALPVGVAGAALSDWLARRRPRRQPLVLGVVLLLFFVQPAYAAFDWTRFKARTDSKVLAEAFVRQLPRGQRIAIELNGAPWSGDPLVEPMTYITANSLDWYRANDYRYLVANMQLRDDKDLPLYRQLAAGATLLRVFPGDDGGQPGPRIEVLDLGPPQPATLAIVQRPANYGDRLKLLGYELQPGDLRAALRPLDGADARVFAPGQAMQLNLTWQVVQPLERDYALFVHIVDAAGATVAQRDAIMRQDEYPSSRWQPGEYVVDRADMPLPALPPGTYSVRIGVYNMATGAPLTLVAPDTGGAPLTLTTIEVR